MSRRLVGRARSPSIGITPFDQAQRSWARSVSSYDDLPAEYRSFFEPLRASGSTFPLVVIAPTYEGFLHREVERLVCATSHDVSILERRGTRLQARRFPIAAISYVEVTSILLDARLKIVGLEGDAGIPAAASVRYNAVTEFLFTPVVTRIRTGGVPGSTAPSGRTQAFDSWGKQSLKFRNYGLRSLLGDEAVLASVLQPEIRRPVLSAFGRSLHRIVSPTHAAILTERELILIHEVLNPWEHHRYGGVWLFIPVSRVERLSADEIGSGQTKLTVHLPGEVRLDALYESAARRPLDDLIEKFSRVRPAKHS